MKRQAIATFGLLCALLFTSPLPLGAQSQLTEEEIKANGDVAGREVYWIQRMVAARLVDEVAGSALQDVFAIERPKYKNSASPYAKFIVDNKLSTIERMALALAISPHIKPRVLDTASATPIGRPVEIFGIEVVGGAYMPSAETLGWLIGSTSLEARWAELRFLQDADHLFSRAGVLSLVPRAGNQSEPMISRRLEISPEYVALFTDGVFPDPKLGGGVSAKRISTDLDWDDLILDAKTMEQVRKIHTWLRLGEELSASRAAKEELSPGYRVLFHGADAFPMRLAAKLLGKSTQREVLEIDLSRVATISDPDAGQILARVFAVAARRDAILLFDEADALFAKGPIGSSLREQMLGHAGLTIVVSRGKKALGANNLRSFESIVYFPPPDAQQRLQIWESAIPETLALAPDVDLQDFAREYSLFQRQILEVVRTATLAASGRDSVVLQRVDLQAAVRDELGREAQPSE